MNNRLLSILAVVVALMMLTTPFLPMVADTNADDSADAEIVGKDADDLVGISDIVAPVGDMMTFDDNEMLTNFMKYLAAGLAGLAALGDDDLNEAEGTVVEIKEATTIADGEMIALTDGNTYSFTGTGCYTIASGGTINLGPAFTLTSTTGNNIIVLESGAKYSVLGYELVIPAGETFTLSIEKSLEVYAAITPDLTGSIDLEAYLDLEGKATVEGHDVVGTDGKEIEADGTIVVSSELREAIMSMDAESIEYALLNSDNALDIKVVVNFKSISMGEVALSDVKYNVDVNFKKPTELKGDKDCLVIAVDGTVGSETGTSTSQNFTLKASVGFNLEGLMDLFNHLTTGALKFSFLLNLDVSMENTDIAVEGYTAKADSLKVSGTADVDMNMTDPFAITLYVDLDLDVKASNADIVSGEGAVYDFDVKVGKLDLHLGLAGNLMDMVSGDPYVIISMIKDTTTMEVDGLDFSMDNDVQKTTAAVDGFKLSMATDGGKLISIEAGSADIAVEPKTGSLDYTKVSAKDIKAPVYLSDTGTILVGTVDAKTLNITTKEIGSDFEQTFKSTDIKVSGLMEGTMIIDEGTVTITDFDLSALPSLTMSKGTTLNSTNCKIRQLYAEEGATLNGDISIYPSMGGLIDCKGLYNLSFSIGSYGFIANFDLDEKNATLTPTTGFTAIKSWVSGVKYTVDDNGVATLSEFEGEVNAQAVSVLFTFIYGEIEKKVGYGEGVSLDEPAERTGYQFVGWDDGSTVFNNNTYVMPARDVKLTEVWSNIISADDVKISGDNTVAISGSESVTIYSDGIDKIQELGAETVEIGLDAGIFSTPAENLIIFGNFGLSMTQETVFDNKAMKKAAEGNYVVEVLINEGSVTQFDKQVRLYFELPDGWNTEDIQVASLEDNGRIHDDFDEEYETIDGKDYVAVWTNHCSYYMLSGSGEQSYNENTALVIAMVVIVVLALAAAAYCAIGRK